MHYRHYQETYEIHNLMEIPRELLPPSKEKETPASLTDPQIRASTRPDPQAILAMSKISSQVGFQSKIGNPMAVSGPYGLGAINPMMSPNAGREVLNTPSPVPETSLAPLAKIVVKKEGMNLLVRAGLLARGVGSITPLGVGANLMATTSTLNAGEEEFLQNQNKILYRSSPEQQRILDEQWRQQALYEEAERKTQDEIFQKQKREREERWSNMKVDELNTKLKTSDDHISRYFSRRAIK